MTRAAAAMGRQRGTSPVLGGTRNGPQELACER